MTQYAALSRHTMPRGVRWCAAHLVPTWYPPGPALKLARSSLLRSVAARARSAGLAAVAEGRVGVELARGGHRHGLLRHHLHRRGWRGVGEPVGVGAPLGALLIEPAAHEREERARGARGGGVGCGRGRRVLDRPVSARR